MKGLTNREKTRAKQAAGLILVNGIQDALDESSSPVKGGRFNPLLIDGSPSTLFEDGDMRSQITFEEGSDSDNSIEVGIFEDAPEIERVKAYAHNTGFKGHPFLDSSKNIRKFVPSRNQSFDDSIMTKVDVAVDSIKQLSRVEDDAIAAILSDELDDILDL